MTIIAVQCRLSSTRLPNKALLTLGNYELLRWTLRTLKKVFVDEYWVACDEESFPVLSKICNEEQWNCFSGPKDDVLERYCLLAEKTGTDVIIRATADNPFLFYEAAIESLVEFEKQSCDYFAFSGLPHGSGVEVFSAKSLLRARDLTTDAYDHEHVGPALYNHPENFTSIFEKAPIEWTTESDSISYRTTVDTISDYRHVWRINTFLNTTGIMPPYTAKDIFSALQSREVKQPLLFVPAVQKGRGTGHIRRVIEIIDNLKKYHNIYSDIFIQDNPSLDVVSIIQNAQKNGIINECNILETLPQRAEYVCIIFDAFKIDSLLAKQMYNLAPVIAIDEGSLKTDSIEYLLNILPPLNEKKIVNAYSPQFLNLAKLKQKKVTEIQKVLVSIGGEDPQQFSNIILDCLQEVFSNQNVQIDCTAQRPISNLKEKMHTYDLVITHYGFTAFEAANAGCAILVVATSPIHKRLSKKYGLVCLEKSDCTIKKLTKVMQNIGNLIPSVLQEAIKTEKTGTLEDFIVSSLQANHYNCPVCNNQKSVNPVIARDTVKTIRKCKTCSMLYVSFCIQEEKEYAKDYFFDEYKKQYGKTYLEDFETIKMQCKRRINHILACKKKFENKAILDIGCAYGPFLQAARESHFTAYGTDISQDAIYYVNNELSLIGATAGFPDFSVQKAFGNQSPKNNTFGAVTMWYVIEHFQNLDSVLKKVNELLDFGGVFAFSTPNALGISRKVNKKQFFAQSPYDHFSIWDYKSAKKNLKKYGFSVKKIVTTGIHKKRFPLFLSFFPDVFIRAIAKILRLGDTFEVYCIKIKDN